MSFSISYVIEKIKMKKKNDKWRFGNEIINLYIYNKTQIYE